MIKQLRQKQNLTQQQLAEKIGIPYQTLQRWESGKFMPSAKYLPALAEALKCKIEELLK